MRAFLSESGAGAAFRCIEGLVLLHPSQQGSCMALVGRDAKSLRQVWASSLDVDEKRQGAAGQFSGRMVHRIELLYLGVKGEEVPGYEPKLYSTARIYVPSRVWCSAALMRDTT